MRFSRSDAQMRRKSALRALYDVATELQAVHTARIGGGAAECGAVLRCLVIVASCAVLQLKSHKE